MDRQYGSAPEADLAIDPAVSSMLQRHRLIYDWEAVAELWPSVGELYKFYRAVCRAINPRHTSISKYDIHLSRDFPITFAIASEYAGVLGVTYAQRNKFIRLLATFVDEPDKRDLRVIREAWQRTLDQKVTLAYLRGSTESIVCPDLAHYVSVLDSHAAGLNAAYAQSRARGDLGKFTIRQLAALSRTDIDPEYAIGVSRHGRQNVADITSLVGVRCPWDYMGSLLRGGMSGTDIAKLYAAGVPLEYATA